MISRQYLELSVPTLYASDIRASAEWYRKIWGFQTLEIDSDSAAMQVVPGVVFYLSTSEDSHRDLAFSTKRMEQFRKHLAENNIVLEEEHDNHWIAFRDPDNNRVGAWSGGFGMELMEIALPD